MKSKEQIKVELALCCTVTCSVAGPFGRRGPFAAPYIKFNEGDATGSSIHLGL